MKKYLPEIEKDDNFLLILFLLEIKKVRIIKIQEHYQLGHKMLNLFKKQEFLFLKFSQKLLIIFILPNEKPKIDFIPSNLGIIDTNIKYDLILDELPIDMSLITKREIEQLPQNENNYQLILTFLDSNKNNSSQRFF